MSDLRKAAQQALDRLRKYHHGNGFVEDAECIVALEAALAQQPEPVCKCDLRTRLVGDGCEVCHPELAAEFAQQPEPAQEPVAWECKAGGLKALTQRQYDAQTAAIKRHYTRIAPPQRPRLTDEEIDSIHIHLSNTVGSSYKTLARAIERKVRGETE